MADARASPISFGSAMSSTRVRSLLLFFIAVVLLLPQIAAKYQNVDKISVPIANMTTLAEEYNKNIRPLLDAVDRLRTLKVTKEGIRLPSIVVVGDQSSGKSSVLESLAMISLPRGQGIVTRVPLVIRLQSCLPDDSSITISYKGESQPISRQINEDQIEAAVNEAQIALAGPLKGVTDTPISLHIRKPGAPDLTMIDLPGITRVPVRGQPDNIYEQIAAMIRHYIEPKETVIMNVLSATADFSTSESVRMSQQHDKKGERTLAVVTKVDKAPDEIYDRVSNDDINIGLGYICVRNRIDTDGSHYQAREKERELFESHPSLSQLEKRSVGIPSLAERLTEIQANIIRKSLPGIQRQVDGALKDRRRELSTLTQGLYSGEDPTVTFLQILDDSKALMQEVMVNGIYDKMGGDCKFHYPPRLENMFKSFSKKLQDNLANIVTPTKTVELMEEMAEMSGLSLPSFFSSTLMKKLVGAEIDKVSAACIDLVHESHDYAKDFAFHMIELSTKAYPKLQAFYKQNLEKAIALSSSSCVKYVERLLEKERTFVFTVNDYYMSNVKAIAAVLKAPSQRFYSLRVLPASVEGFEGLNLYEGRGKSNEYQAAFTMKVSLAAYWKVVHRRLADEIPMEIRFSLVEAILKRSRNDMLSDKLRHSLSDLMEEDPALNRKKEVAKTRLKTLEECKDVLHALHVEKIV